MKKILIHTPTWLMFVILMLPFVGAAFIPFYLGTTISFIVIVLWLYAVVHSIKDKIGFTRVDLRLFHFTIFFPLCYMISLNFIYFEPWSNIILTIAHFVSCLSVLYSIYFAAKLLVISEEGRVLKFDRYIGTLFLFWFFMVGVWFIHPRVRKVLQK